MEKKLPKLILIMETNRDEGIVLVCNDKQACSYINNQITFNNIFLCVWKFSTL